MKMKNNYYTTSHRYNPHIVETLERPGIDIEVHLIDLESYTFNSL
jgi:hypothetical protein